MTTEKKYIHSDRMISLIAENYRLIQVMSRFGIPMGFGDKTVSEVCSDAGVDTDTFLAVVNFIIDGFSSFNADTDVSVQSLLHFLRQSHIYFLQYCLPAIRLKLLDSIRMRPTDISFLILKLFDEYVQEVSTHMNYEDETVFKYVQSILNGMPQPNYKINTYSEHHDQVGSKLKELKSIIIKYCPADAHSNQLNDALYDIYRCEEELESHCRIEDCILVPAIMRLEERHA
ncbi:MAG: hemerythrin domain-containing protein [Muribaculaceae bacterium]|nr:hemerythrin domain-containing protein [Muribaculaceae bacterium]